MKESLQHHYRYTSSYDHRPRCLSLSSHPRQRRTHHRHRCQGRTHRPGPRSHLRSKTSRHRRRRTLRLTHGVGGSEVYVRFKREERPAKQTKIMKLTPAGSSRNLGRNCFMVCVLTAVQRHDEILENIFRELTPGGCVRRRGANARLNGAASVVAPPVSLVATGVAGVVNLPSSGVTSGVTGSVASSAAVSLCTYGSTCGIVRAGQARFNSACKQGIDRLKKRSQQPMGRWPRSCEIEHLVAGLFLGEKQ